MGSMAMVVRGTQPSQLPELHFINVVKENTIVQEKRGGLFAKAARAIVRLVDDSNNLKSHNNQKSNLLIRRLSAKGWSSKNVISYKPSKIVVKFAYVTYQLIAINFSRSPLARGNDNARTARQDDLSQNGPIVEEINDAPISQLPPAETNYLMNTPDNAYYSPAYSYAPPPAVRVPTRFEEAPVPVAAERFIAEEQHADASESRAQVAAAASQAHQDVAEFTVAETPLPASTPAKAETIDVETAPAELSAPLPKVTVDAPISNEELTAPASQVFASAAECIELDLQDVQPKMQQLEPIALEEAPAAPILIMGLDEPAEAPQSEKLHDLLEAGKNMAAAMGNLNEALKAAEA
ncbi:MAG TPA: hypothetical protein VF797_22090 [Noviherbaspirillum sp.]